MRRVRLRNGHGLSRLGFLDLLRIALLLAIWAFWRAPEAEIIRLLIELAGRLAGDKRLMIIKLALRIFQVIGPSAAINDLISRGYNSALGVWSCFLKIGGVARRSVMWCCGSVSRRFREECSIEDLICVLLPAFSEILHDGR